MNVVAFAAPEWRWAPDLGGEPTPGVVAQTSLTSARFFDAGLANGRSPLLACPGGRRPAHGRCVAPPPAPVSAPEKKPFITRCYHRGSRVCFAGKGPVSAPV